MKLPPWLWRTFRSPWLKRVLICSPFILSIGAVAFYQIVNWWAVRAFEQTVMELKAAGYSTRPEEIISAGSNPEEEVFRHPLLVAELSITDGSGLGRLRGMSLPGVSSKSKAWEFIPGIHRSTDIRNWADPPRSGDPEEVVAKSILVGIQPQSDHFDALTPAFDRPGGGWYDGDLEKNLYRILALRRMEYFAEDRAILYLAAGDNTKSAADVETLLKIHEVFGKNPCLVSIVVSRGTLSSTSRIIGEGVQRRMWTDAQLEKFQTMAAKVDPQGTAVNAVVGEVPLSISEIRKIIALPDHGRLEPEWEDIRSNLWSGIVGRDAPLVKKNLRGAWINVRPWGLHLVDMTDWLKGLRAEGFHPGAGRRQSISIADQKRYDALKGLQDYEQNCYATLSQVARYVLGIETRLGLLKCGIATERYRLKHGTLPPDLKALVPEFLPAVPADVCDANPLRYRILPDGSPLIWSLWPQGIDLGGMPKRNPEKGNLIWTTGQIPGLDEASYKR